MANLKLWQSLGIGLMFALAQMNDMKLSVLILMVALVLSSAALLGAHACVANLDSGRRHRSGRAQ